MGSTANWSVGVKGEERKGNETVLSEHRSQERKARQERQRDGARRVIFSYTRSGPKA